MTSDGRRRRTLAVGLLMALTAALPWLSGCDGADSASGAERPSASTAGSASQGSPPEPAADGAHAGERPEPARESAGASGAPSGGRDRPGETRAVRVVRPEAGALTVTRSVSARVQPVRDSRVAPGASGRVLEVLARPGAPVEAGEVVLRLDDRQDRLQVDGAREAVEQARIDLERARRANRESIAQLEASLRSARVSAELAHDAYEDGRALYEAGGISRTELRQLESQREQAEAQRVQASDALARARRGEAEDLALLEVQLRQARNQLEQAQERLSQTRVTAPFAGEIAELYVEAGESAAAGNPAFRVQSIREQEVVAELPPEDAERLRQRGEIHVRHGGLDYAAHVTGITRPQDRPRQVRLVARLYESESRIPNGAVADLRYSVTLAEGLLLPSGALAAEGGATYVYVVEEGVAVRIPVQVRAEAGAQAVVEGIEPGTPVISPRPLDVRDGTRVTVADG